MIRSILRNLARHFKEGLKTAPWIFIALYIVFNLLDFYTTWLGTPDLKHEGNWIIRKFHLGWDFIIIRDIIATLILIPGIIISQSVFSEFYYNPTRKERFLMWEILRSPKLFLCTFISFSLYIDLFYTIYLVPSNYLQAIYLQNIENILTALSHSYVNKVILINGTLLFRIIYSISVSAGVLYTLFKIKEIKELSVLRTSNPLNLSSIIEVKQIINS
jgi:hypothetical protein